MVTLTFQATEAGAEENLEQMIEQTRALREKFLRDRHRPLYHFVSPEGVCNPFDPNGSIFWKGQYHLMYIFQTGTRGFSPVPPLSTSRANLRSSTTA
jgi:sucrose-6-phosphate hydrolase SacC (GH32 family)